MSKQKLNLSRMNLKACEEAERLLTRYEQRTKVALVQDAVYFIKVHKDEMLALLQLARVGQASFRRALAKQAVEESNAKRPH